jgi:PadR family transcriptional regulator, regulatory protein PadR
MPPPEKTDLLLGTLDLLVLKVLDLQPLHGLGVARRIEQVTRGAFQVKPGSLFPSLYRMEHAGWLTSTWGQSETNRRARYYRLTSAGRRRLATETEQWERIAAAMTLALQASDS